MPYELWSDAVSGNPRMSVVEPPVTVKASILEVQNLQKRFRRSRAKGASKSDASVYAVRGISLRVGVGEALGLVGETGSGKTTVGRCVVGLETATAGLIRVRGRDIGSLGRRDHQLLRRDVQMVFQDPHSSLNPRMTVRSTIEEPLRLLAGAGRELRRKETSEIPRGGRVV